MIIKEATALAKTAGEAAQHYLKVMNKIANSSEEYLEKERARFVLVQLATGLIICRSNLYLSRLASILKKRALNDKKLDEIKVKANILASFVVQKVEEAEESAEETLEQIKEGAEKIAKEFTREEL